MSKPFSKRDWIYGGISHPRGVILARKTPVRRLVPGSTLAVVGDEHVAGLAPVLRQLASSSGVGLVIDIEPGTCFERWYSPGRLSKVLAARPAIVLVSLGICSATGPLMPLLRSLAAEVYQAGAGLAWIRPPENVAATKSLRVLLRAARIPSFHSETLEVARSVGDKPSARGYAGWSGALWRWIG